MIEGGLFACTSNLQNYSKNIVGDPARVVSQFVFLCVLTFPPQDEVYFAIAVGQEAEKVNGGLIKLLHEVEERNKTLVGNGGTASKINNNVKFYITSNGNIYFHNTEFLNRIDEATLDPDCLARVDAIQFSIWPPAVSARRSLLAREFVGYLGSLVGKERVHELAVWLDASALSPQMRRLPDTLDAGAIEISGREAWGVLSGRRSAPLSRRDEFPQTQAFRNPVGLVRHGEDPACFAVCPRGTRRDPNDAADPLLFVCPVRPEWTDPTGLTGYFDVLSNRYVVPRFLEAVLVATAQSDAPVFVVLDEMNLARVEHYFSDVLSCIETGEDLQLHSNGVPIEGTTGTSIPAALPLPANLYITGTINVDETTNPVSDKVLDRALVIDMSKVELPGFFKSWKMASRALRMRGQQRNRCLSPCRSFCFRMVLASATGWPKKRCVITLLPQRNSARHRTMSVTS